MPLYSDVGMPSGAFSLLILLLCGPALAIALVARRCWQLAVARQEEVRRLALLAAEEATRAEMEAMETFAVAWADAAPIAAAAVSVANDTLARPKCAVCFSPAAARCAQCKAVRYCSGKCQIVHWRHGHKDECRRSLIYRNSGEINISDLDEVQANEYLLNKGFKPQEEINTAAVNVFPFPSESIPESTCQSHLNYDKHKEKTLVNLSVKEKTCSFAPFPVTSHISNIKTSSDALTGGIQSEIHVDLLGESSPSDAQIDLGTTFVTCDESFGASSSAEFARTNLWPKPTPSDCVDNTSTVKTEGSILTGSSDIIAAATLEPITTRDREITGEHLSQRAGNGNYLSVNSRMDGSPGSIASSDAHSQSNPKEMPFPDIETSRSATNGTIMDMDLLKSKSSRYPASPYDHVSPNSDAPQVISHKSSKVGNSSRVPIRSPDSSGAIANGFSTVSLKSSTSVSIANGMRTGVELLKPEISRSLATARDQLSANGVNHPTGHIVTSKVGDVLGGPTVSPYTSDGVSNVPATSSTRIVKQITSRKSSKHYSSELMLFPYELFIKLYNPDKIEFRPCGIINCGNSCYANAVLQCLAFTRPLTAYLLEGLHSTRCPKKEWCFTCELESLVVNAKSGKSPLSAIGILSHLQNLGSNFGHGLQEDAHEFLRYAINAMQSDCLRESGAKPDCVLADETTLMQQTFGGYLRSKIRCSKCKGKSERCERMLDLTVEIDGDVATLDEALSRFTSPEILEGENKYECERCKSYERARKKLTILEAPNVLTIVLKRFQSGKFGKLNKTVEFPEYLNLARYMSGDDTSPVYQLFAVVVHIDAMNASFSGHYVCYVKDTQGKWYKTNDSEVEPVELDEVLSKEAYMLLYARCSPRAPSSVRKALAHDLIQARKARSKEAKGTPGASSVAEQKNHHFQQQIGCETAGLRPPDPYERLVGPAKNDSSSDSSSLFDEEGTRDSTSTEDSTSMSGESDSVNPNSPPRASDGLTRSHGSSGSSSKAAVELPAADLPRQGGDHGSEDACSPCGQSERTKPQNGVGAAASCTGNGRPSFLYTDKSGDCKNVGERSRRTIENEGVWSISVLLRRVSREKAAAAAQTFY